MFSPDDARRLAADPGTDAATLYQLAQQHPEVLPALAENPSTYPDLLGWLGSLGNPEVTAALQRRQAASAADAPQAAPSADTQADAAPAEQPTVAAPAVETSSATVAETQGVDAPTEPPTKDEPSGEGDQPTVVAEPEPPLTQPARPTQSRAERAAGATGAPDSAASGPAAAGGVAAAGSAAAAGGVAAAATPPGGAPGRQSILNRSGSDGSGFSANSAASQHSPSSAQQSPHGSAGSSTAAMPASVPPARQMPHQPQYPPVHQSYAPSQGPSVPSPYQQNQPGYAPYSQPRQEEQKRGLPAALWAVIGALAVLLLLGLLWITGVFGGSGNEEEPAPVPTATTEASPSVEPSSEPTTEPTTEESPTEDPEADLNAARDSMTAAATSGSCADPAVEADAITAFSAAAREIGGDALTAANDDVTQALTDLQSSCTAAYAVDVAEAAAADTPDIAALSDLGWVVPTVPAPEGAQALPEFQAPSGNIACALSGNGAVCTIHDYDFSPAEGCAAGDPVTVVIDADGARQDCSRGPVNANGTSLDYGAASAQDRYFCTSSESGMSCTDSWSGESFNVARAGASITEAN